MTTIECLPVHLQWEYAALCLESILARALDAGREPDDRTWAVVEALRAKARGEITQNEMWTVMDGVKATYWATYWGVWAAAWDAVSAAYWAAYRASSSWATARGVALDVSLAAARVSLRAGDRDAELRMQRETLAELGGES